MTDSLKAYQPDEEPFDDHERDNRGSVDPTSYEYSGAQQASRGCKHCGGEGLATVYDAEYTGSPVIEYLGPNGERRKRSGRVMAYCVCLLGRWLENNHRLNAKDARMRMPDLADILGKPSFWLERDPSACDGNFSIDNLPEFRRAFASKLRPK